MPKSNAPAARRILNGRALIIFDWVSTTGNEADTEPTMAICRTHAGKGVSYLIPLSCAYQYGEGRSGEATKFLIARSKAICEALGLDPDRRTCALMAMAVVDNLPDLISMRPWEGASPRELENRADRQGLKVKVGDHTILDATR